jgi:hypothetical protein
MTVWYSAGHRNTTRLPGMTVVVSRGQSLRCGRVSRILLASLPGLTRQSIMRNEWLVLRLLMQNLERRR